MLLNIQALRAFAACLVVVVHLGTLMSAAGVATTPMAFGNSGVDLFFVLSGFLMVHTTSIKPVSAGSFFLNRLIRVAPLYWLFTLAVAALGVVRPEWLATTRVSWVALVKSLLFIPFAKPNGQIQPLLFLGWTLDYEMFFYLVFAASLLLPRRLAFWTATGVIVALVAGGGLIKPASLAGRFYTGPIMLEFVFGMLLARLLGQKGALSSQLAWAAAFAGIVVLLGRYAVVPDGDRAWWSGVPATLILAGILSLERRGMVWSNRPVQLLGAASYSLYLVHPFVIQALSKTLLVTGLAAEPWWLAGGAALLFVLVVAAAITVHWLVERPITAELRRLIRHQPSAVDRGERRLGLLGRR